MIEFEHELGPDLLLGMAMDTGHAAFLHVETAIHYLKDLSKLTIKTKLENWTYEFRMEVSSDE